MDNLANGLEMIFCGGIHEIYGIFNGIHSKINFNKSPFNNAGCFQQPSNIDQMFNALRINYH